MTWSPDSSITGGAQTGLTSPTYGNVTDQAPSVNGRQIAVTSLGGTQTGVRSHTVSDPFTATFVKPAVLKTLPAANPVTGLYGNIPKNTYQLLIRKGVQVAANQPSQIMLCRLTVDVPAGADSYDAANVRAALSFLVGLLSEESADLGDTAVTGILS
jgi:hypothetical protein